MAHLHVTAWVLAIILLIIVSYSYKNNDGKLGKILHMVLRLDLVVILVTGAILFFSYNQINGELIVKVIAGLWTLVAIEMICVKTNKQNPAKAWWIQFVIMALIAIILGFGRLPLGVLP